MATQIESDDDALYRLDYYAWTRVQAEGLRRLAAARPNDALDWPNLIEEVEDLGRRELKAVRSQLRRIIEHLLKLEHATAPAPRRGWLLSVSQARAELEDDLTPSLRDEAEQALPRIYALAKRTASDALVLFDEEGAAAALPEACPYSLEQLLDPDWLPRSNSAG